jgi:hypothetical protein
LGFFQIGRGSAGINPLAEFVPAMARFFEVEFPFEPGKDQPQFRFPNEISITRVQLGLQQSLVSSQGWQFFCRERDPPR